MRLSRSHLPGAGFVLLVVTTLASAGLLTWASRTPRLERVWELSLALAEGSDTPLLPEEFGLLQATLTRYPQVANDLLEGEGDGVLGDGDLTLHECVYLLRSAPTPGTQLVVTLAAGGGEGESATLTVRTLATEVHGRLTREEPFVWSPPNSGPFPQLLELRRVRTNGEAPPLVVRLVTTSAGGEP